MSSPIPPGDKTRNWPAYSKPLMRHWSEQNGERAASAWHPDHLLRSWHGVGAVTDRRTRQAGSLGNFAERLGKAGTPHKVIIAAVARKLVTRANALCKTRQQWMPSER